MINALPDDSLMSKLSQLEKCKHINFCITGSRFFKTMNNGSDWDFFTEDSNETREFLANIGFKSTVSYKSDPSITTVLQWGEKLWSERIHIQLISPETILVKEKAQQIIVDNDLVSPCKSEMFIIWKAVIATLLSQQDESPVRR